ncbi:MAG: hypothetical protein ACR2NZ_06300 [Rubripirellula sp.]
MLKRKYGYLPFGVSLFFALAIPIESADAVDPPTGAPTANQNMVTEFKGTLKGLQKGMVVIQREDGTEVMVQPPDDLSAFQFVATAKPAFLQRGMMVRFNGTFNQAGVPMAPVARLEIFQPISGKVAGHNREQFVPGVHADRKDRGKPPKAIANYTVVGQLMGWDASGGFMVRAGQRSVRAQLTQTAALEIRFNNLNLAKEGDSVSVAGFYQPPDETKVKGDRVTITTDRIFGEPVEPTKRVSRRRRRGDEDEAGDGEKKRDDEAAANAENQEGEASAEDAQGEKANGEAVEQAIRG